MLLRYGTNQIEIWMAWSLTKLKFRPVATLQTPTVYTAIWIDITFWTVTRLNERNQTQIEVKLKDGKKQMANWNFAFADWNDINSFQNIKALFMKDFFLYF